MDINESPTTSRPVLPKGRTKACTACRQVKLKCNAKDVYPKPCTRCVAQHLDCRMDPTFKRVPARKQLEEVTSRLMNLQRSLGLDEEFTAPSKPKDPPHRQSSDPHLSLLDRAVPRRQSSIASGSDGEPGATDGRFLDLIDEPHEGQWALGNVILNYEQVLKLFQHFDKMLWRHAPFVEPCNSLHGLYKTSELLFWTIILVSGRLNNSNDSIYMSLIQPHRALLGNTILTLRPNLKSIHSLLIVCTWPYAVHSQFDDITWTTVGACVNIAMSVGMHKPEHGHEYTVNDASPVDGTHYYRNMTWMACFEISTSIAAWLGLPPSISSQSQLETIDALIQDTRYPRTFCAKVEIQRHITRIINALDAKLDFRARYSLIKLYEQDLDRLHSTFTHSWTDELEVDWLGAKLFLYGMAFVSSDTQTTPRETHDRAIEAREMLQYGLSSASRLISTVANMNLPAIRSGDNRTGLPDYVFQLGFYPKHFFRIAAFASFFLLWYLVVDVDASESDKDLATRGVATVYRLLYAMKHSEEHTRAAKSIEMMARFGAAAPEHNVQAAYLLVNSRLGSSFMYSLKYGDFDQPSSVHTQRLVDMHSAQEHVHAAAAAVAAGGSGVIGSVSDPSETQSPDMATEATTASSWHASEPEKEGNVSQPGIGLPVGEAGEFAGTVNAGPQGQPQQKQKQMPSAHHGQPQYPPAQRPQQFQPPPQMNRQQQQQQQQTNLPTSFDPSAMFSDSFFGGGAANANFDFLWQNWDPAVFDDLKMDLDDEVEQVGFGDAA